MWRTVEGTILIVACVQAQSFNDLLLPQSRHILGTVVDSEGKPIAEARIDHSNDRRQIHQTDSGGRFKLDTRAPTFVVRKTGFRSELVRTQDATEPRVTLQKLSEKRPFPTCSNTGTYDGIDGWGATIQFPRDADVKAARQIQDIDHGVRSYYVDTESGSKGARHGSGPMWSFGTPLDRDVWRSVGYEEIAYDVGGQTIVDARGQLPNGQRWRYLGKFGESASYTDVDEATAKTLDRFLDGACLRPIH
jgi:hypothetical protein